MGEISELRYRGGEGEPLVLVHGFTATWRCWRPVLPELVTRFEVIAPTLHGHDGGPNLPPGHGARSSEEGADHFEALLDELGIDTAHFAGNSLGGAVALEMAKRGRARSVVAISPGGGWSREIHPEEGERIIKWFKRNNRLAKLSLSTLKWTMRRPGFRRFALRDVMTRGDQMSYVEAIQLVRSSTRCTVMEEVFDAIRSGDGLLTGLDRIECPVLVTWGEKDRILPLARHGQRFRDEIPGVEFRVQPGIGHTPMWDDPLLIAATIGDFAAAHAAAPAVA